MSLQAAAERALELEQEGGASASYRRLSAVFGAGAQTLDDTDPRVEFLRWEAGLYRYQLRSSTQDARGGEEFGAFMEMTDGRRDPPRVREFPEGAIPYFRHRLQSAGTPSARARLADFLWVRTRELPLAELAIREYLAAASAVLPEQDGTMVAAEYLIRAGDLSRSLGQDGANLRAAIRQLAESLLDGSGFLGILVRGTAQLIAQDTNLTDWLLGELTRLADEAAARGGQARFSERSFLMTAAELANEKQDAALVKTLRIRTAQSFELEADERAADAPLVQSALLQDAMKAYGDLGLSADLQRVKPRVHEASERAGSDLKEISASMTISDDVLRQEMQKLVEYGRQRTPWLHLQIFAIRGLWPAWSEVVERTTEYQRRFPLQSAVSKIILGPDNRPLPRPSDPVAARQFDEIEYYVRDIQLRLGLYSTEIEMLREIEGWDEHLLMDALASGLMFSADTLSALRLGVVAFEAGRYWEALHTLVPQIERVIRELARMLGANVYRFQSGTGEIYWSSLKTLLELETVRTVLGRIRPNLADELRYVLIDSRGLNLRDDVAHGIIQPGQQADTRALLCLLILLTLSVPQLAASTTKGQAEST
jgi:hypothetical protein